MSFKIMEQQGIWSKNQITILQIFLMNFVGVLKETSLLIVPMMLIYPRISQQWIMKD